MQNLLDKLLKKIITLIEKEGLDYLIIGGLAVGFLGESRMTQDIDLILFISKEKLEKFLSSAKSAGFKFDRTFVLKEAQSKGAFKLMLGDLWVDVILASTEFEQSAFARKTKIKFIGSTLNLPSPEDFILLKIIPGRDKDLLDAKSVVERHGSKLDKKYLEKWAQKLSDEAEDLRIWNILQQLLGTN